MKSPLIDPYPTQAELSAWYKLKLKDKVDQNFLDKASILDLQLLYKELVV